MKKQNLKIKGKILVQDRLCDLPMGKEGKGFVDFDTFALYKNKLYINQEYAVSSKITDFYIIPVKRISEDIDGFEFDLRRIPVSICIQETEPKEEEGWIGPFDVEQEKFSWYEYYYTLPLANLENLWSAALEEEDWQEEKFLRKIRRIVFKEHYVDASLLKLKEQIIIFTDSYKALDDGMTEQKTHQIDDDLSLESVKIISYEFSRDIKILKSFYNSRKKAPLSDLSLDDLKYLYDITDKKSKDADFDFLAKIQKEMRFRQSESISPDWVGFIKSVK